jgi:hypothetical protein
MTLQNNFNKVAIILCIALGFILLGGTMVAGLQGGTVWYVATNGSDSNDCLSLPTACFTMNSMKLNEKPEHGAS